MIRVIGLGPGSKQALTLGAVDLLKNSENIYFRTENYPNVEYLKSLGVKFKSYDYLYQRLNNLDEISENIAKDLVDKHSEFKEIIYVVPGHPLEGDKTVKILIDSCKEKNIDIEILPTISFIDTLVKNLKIDVSYGIKIIDSFDVKDSMLDKKIETIIVGLYNKDIISVIKTKLCGYYNDNTDIYFIKISDEKKLEKVKSSIGEIDKQQDDKYISVIYIPRCVDTINDFQDLLDIMNTLRSENGCPWDREQTHKSLKRCLIEECYEVLEAIDEMNYDKITEELGDVLLQVVFHAQIGKEENHFNINDVIKRICNKLIERHPHVFAKMNVSNAKEVLVNWDKIKKKEKGFKTYTDELKHVAKNLPALIRADKVQNKAAKVGFDWDDVMPAINKVLEEADEVKEVYKSQNKEKIIEEVGDLIFSTVNIARLLDIDPEHALNYTIDKFIRRFQYIERKGSEKGKNLKQMSLKEMDELWEKSKLQ
ncbi:nucleoside triphosphate pyrophosphohydrolase [Clostridium aestuarii]|uniref:Nucleoside triphosphate pyrophosphohydrolase n=1 Tax=Clostridium aestuarii TaxID=338193 RepID=A0ABT4D3A0_9CLOT|nr:nucleoside triphosphate pyrophosphohydrolase [Clostridium aestuarii]MCY6485711.1 nucleoside triphosphate pyrophosphohydrolase [Clostridium aestuarii]